MKRLLWLLPLLLLIMSPLLLTSCKDKPSSPAVSLQSDLETLLQHGIDLAEQGKLTEAIAIFDQVIEMEPGSAVAYNDRGLANYQNGDPDKALVDLQKAIDLEPTAAIPYANRGLIHQALGKKPEAIADLEKFISLTDDQTVVPQVQEIIDQLKQ